MKLLQVFTLSLLVAKLSLGSCRPRGTYRRQDTTELFFSVTYRDFLPSSCYYAFDDDDLEQIQKDAWEVNIEPELSSQARCALLAANTGWESSLLNREILGHPDFEPAEQMTNANQCQSGNNGANFPRSTCRDEPGAGDDAAIIKEELAIASSGLPKPIYCKDEPNSRCGRITDDPGGGRSGFTQTRKEYFDLWYSIDDPRYSKRIGQRLKLTETSDPGVFKFDSKEDNDAPDFGDTTLNFFGPLDRFKTYFTHLWRIFYGLNNYL